MIAFLLKRPVALTMFFLAVVILGVLSYRNISIEGQPDLELPQLVVETNWNSPPEVVQVFLTSPIEEAGAQLEGLEEMESSSGRNRSSVTLKFNRETDMDFARIDLNERLSNLRQNLPPGATQPRIRMIDTNDDTQQAFMNFNVSGPFDMQYLTELVKEQIINELSALPGVAEVEIRGEQEKSLKIQLNRTAMDLYGLVPSMVTRKINELTTTYETARTFYSNQEYTITISNSIPDIATVENAVLTKYKDQLIRIKDVGLITLGYSKLRNMSRLNGNPTLSVSVHKEVGANVIETAKMVKRTLDAKLERMSGDVRVDWVRDEGELMEEELASVYTRSIWCVVLIVVLLLFFLQSFSAAMVITLNILFSVLLTVNFMYYFDITFNIVTLSGLAVGFGMLVDNAIVVLENIFRFREEGATRFEAAVEGAKEVIWAIFAATLTTVASFLCMIFLEDRLAAAYWPLALAVIFSLSASLLISFTFTPLLSLLIRGSSIKKKQLGDKGFVTRFISQPLEKMAQTYESIVAWTLNHKFLVLFAALSLFFMFVQIFRTEIDSGGFTFGFGRDDSLFVYIRMPEGAELETGNDVIQQFEKPLLELDTPGYKDVSTQVYATAAFIQITFDSDMLSTAYPLALKSRLITIAQGFAGVTVSVTGINSDDNYFSGSTGMESYNSSIRLLGYNYKRLMDYGNDILRTVSRNKRVRETKLETSKFNFFSRDQTETTLQINRGALRRHDVNLSYLLGFINTNLRVESMARTKFRGEEMEVEVKFNDADDFDIKALENLLIRTETGKEVRLSELFEVGERKVSAIIDRKDQQYMVNVRWNYKGSHKKARTFNEAMFESLELPPGFKAEMDNTEFLSNDEKANLRFVIIIAMVMVFMIISSLYESFVDPLVIFITIPFSFIGVSWIYWYTGRSFDSTAYIGLIILAGIVVNNSILLVSHINNLVQRGDVLGLSFHQAVARACKDRLRPILLTAITTIVGLLPLLEEFVNWFLHNPVSSFIFDLIGYEITMGNMENSSLQVTLDMFSSLSRSTVGGMLSATLSTLFVIPVVYVVFFRAKQWLHVRINEVFHHAAEQ